MLGCRDSKCNCDKCNLYYGCDRVKLTQEQIKEIEKTFEKK